MKIKNKGFTLIELMVTVVIIGILGAIAVPAYQDYTIRSQVTEGLSLASGAKVAVAEYYQNHGRYPADMATIGMISSQGNFIKETKLEEEGKITAVFGKESNHLIHDGMISLVPTENNMGNLEWECHSSIDSKYLPNSCGYVAPLPIIITIENTCQHDIVISGDFKYCMLNGKRHNEYGPAAEHISGQKEWYQNGQLHREDGPAHISPNGTKNWYQNGQLHREDGPSVEWSGGMKEWYLNNVRYAQLNERGNWFYTQGKETFDKMFPNHDYTLYP